MADENKAGPLPSAAVAADEPSVWVSQNILKGGEECWSCGITPGTNPESTMPSILITSTDVEEDCKQIEFCEDCAAEIFRFFTMEHLSFMKDKEKHKNWIFSGSPFFVEG